MIPQRYFLTIVFAALIASGNSAQEQMSESLLHGPGKEEPTPMEDRNLGAVPSSSCPHLKAFFQEDLHHHDLIRSHFEDLMNSAYIGLSRQDNDRAFAKYMDFIKQSCHAGDESSGRRRLLPTEEEVSQEEKDFRNKASPLRGVPFNKAYYNVSADHVHNDIYWKLNPKTFDQRNPLQPDPSSDATMTSRFIRENYFIRSTVRNDDDFSNPIIQNRLIASKFDPETTLEDKIPELWSQLADAFRSIEAFQNQFQVFVPPTVSDYPLDIQASDDQGKMDWILNLPQGTIARALRHWYNPIVPSSEPLVEADLLLVRPTANALQPAFAGFILFYFPMQNGDIPLLPTFYCIVSATGGGTPGSLFPNAVSQEYNTPRSIVAPAGLRFSPLSSEGNIYTHYLRYKEGESQSLFEMSITCFYEKAPPPMKWETMGRHSDDGSSEPMSVPNSPYLVVTNTVSGVDEPPVDKTPSILKILDKGATMNEITKAYFEKLDITTLRVVDPTGTNEESAKALETVLLVPLLEFQSWDFFFEKGEEPRVVQDK